MPDVFIDVFAFDANCCAKASSILDDDDEGMTPIIIPTTSVKHKPPSSSSAAQPSTDPEPLKPASAIDITADDILPRLTPPNVTDLVLLSMVRHHSLNFSVLTVNKIFQGIVEICILLLLLLHNL